MFCGVNISSLKVTDWYQIKRKNIIDHGGKGMFTQYRSMQDALKTIYPEIVWEAHHFATIPKGFWHIKANITKALEKAELDLNVTQVI